MSNLLLSATALVLTCAAQTATSLAPTNKQALQPLQDLIGSWRGTGEPHGTREEKQKGFWTETIRWEWQFKGSDAWLRAAVEKGKHLKGAELRYLPQKGLYQLTLQPTAGEKQVYTGKLQNRRLTLERGDDPAKPGQRVVLSLLHANRHLFRYEERPAERTTFVPVYQVGATKEGVPFAGGGSQPECIVTGGRGTMTVSYKGKTYYVCCSGCRDAFLDDPETFIQDYEAKKAKEK
jgi:YHS domain-containing protein